MSPASPQVPESVPSGPGSRTALVEQTDLLERTCAHARRFAEGLREAGYPVLNDVVLNQVLVSFGSAEQTLRTVKTLQQEGTCWCSTTVWQGTTAMRISVSSWDTRTEDVEKSQEAMLQAASNCAGTI